MYISLVIAYVAVSKCRAAAGAGADRRAMKQASVARQGERKTKT
jgi:hypothetical protein